MEDAASAACQTEFSGGRDAIAKEMHTRFDGLTPLNISMLNMKIDDEATDEAPQPAQELDPAKVRALATKLLTEGGGALVQS